MSLVHFSAKNVIQLSPTRKPRDGEFQLPSSIRTPRLSDRIVCLPWGSDNRDSTVFQTYDFKVATVLCH